MRPLFYSFRRCPYAMRARLALIAAGQQVELREILLRDKPAAMIAASSKGTVPVLVTQEGIIDQSLDVMLWALGRSDPCGWLEMPPDGMRLIAQNDGPFKAALDRVKYAVRYPKAEADTARQTAMSFLEQLDAQMGDWLFDRPSLADFSILPFVRQFAMIDSAWFGAQPLPRLQAWLARFLGSEDFATAMQKFPQWQDGDAPVIFPARG